MTAPVQTQGPIDANAGTRAKLYSGLAVITPLLGFLATFNIVTTEQGNAITGFITAAMGLLGVLGFGLAASKTNKQVANGTFDAAPPVSPAVVAVDGVKAVIDQVTTLNDAVAEGMQRMQDIAGVLGVGSVLGPLAQQVIDRP